MRTDYSDFTETAWLRIISLSFSVSGVGEVAAVGSGDPKDPSSFQAMHRNAWRGKALVILRPIGEQPGTIVLKATSVGLSGAEVMVHTT